MYCTNTMKSTGKKDEAFENFAKEVAASFSTNPDDLSTKERAILENFILSLRDMGGINDPFLTPGEKLRLLAEKHMKKMIELLNICYKLNQAPLPSDPLIQKFLSSDDARIEGLLGYTNALRELETIMPSRQKAIRRQAAQRHADNDW